MRTLLCLGLFAVSVMAADPAFTIWRASDIKAKEKQLAAKATPQQGAFETLATYGNHLTMLAHRVADGEVEVHEKMADIFVVESGQATLLVGGKVEGARTTAAGELRGGTIQGGERQKIGPGDVIHIPAGVPHQVLLGETKAFTYFVVKVEKP